MYTSAKHLLLRMFPLNHLSSITLAIPRSRHCYHLSRLKSHLGVFYYDNPRSPPNSYRTDTTNRLARQILYADFLRLDNGFLDAVASYRLLIEKGCRYVSQWVLRAWIKTIHACQRRNLPLTEIFQPINQLANLVRPHSETPAERHR